MPGLIQFDALMYGGEIIAGSTVALIQSIFDGTALPISVVAPPSPPEGMLNLTEVTINIYSPTMRLAVRRAPMLAAPTVPGMFYYYHGTLATDEVGRWKAKVRATWSTHSMESPVQEAFAIASPAPTWRSV